MVRVTLNPSLLSENLAQAQDGSTSCGGNACWSCGSAAGTTVTNPNSVTSVDQLRSCLTTTRSWLTISSTPYSIYGYLAKKYAPYRFTVLHEPTSNNANYGFNATVGSPSNWLNNFLSGSNGVINAVQTNSSTSRIAIAFDRFELSPTDYQSTLIGASGLQDVGYDVYTNDLANTSSGLGAQATMIANARAAGKSTFFSEVGWPAWAPASGQATDGNAYEGIGNCDWWLYDVIRQDETALTLWGVSQGITEINFFDPGDVGALCVFLAPGTGHDRLADGTYAGSVALSLGYRTPTFRFFQQLIQWPSTITPGLSLPF